MEAKDPKSAETAAGDEGETASRKPDAAATSDETLSDVEEGEKVSDNESVDSNAATPSPDGAFDEGRGDAGDVGPM